MLHVGSTTSQPSNKATNGQQGLIGTRVSYLILGCCRAAAAALSISFELQFLFFRVHVNVTQLLASLHVVPTPSCVEMAFEVLLLCLRCFVFFRNTFAILKTCPINVGSLLSAHLLRSTRRSLLGGSLHVHYLQAACLWHTSPTASHGICLSSTSNISSSSSNHPISHLSRMYKPAHSLPALNSDTIQLL